MSLSYTKIFIKRNIMIYVSDLTKITNIILNYHKYPPFSNLILANAICAFSPLKFLYKIDNFMIKINTNGAIKSLIFELKNNSIRTLISNPNIETEYDNKDINHVPLILGLGDYGFFEMTKEVKKEFFTSKTQMAKYDIVTDLAFYLNKSDQIYSAIINDVKIDKKNKNIVTCSKNILFQLLPNHDEEDKIWIENFISKNDFKNLSIDEIIKKIDSEELNMWEIDANCWCSKQKMIQAIKLLPNNEKKELFIDKNNVEVVCEFCKTKHIIYEKDINE